MYIYDSGSELLDISNGQLALQDNNNNPDWLNNSNNSLYNSDNRNFNNTYPPPGSSQQLPQISQNGGLQKPPPRRRFATDDEKFASIDHVANAERLKQMNYLKYRAKYGDDDMRFVSQA